MAIIDEEGRLFGTINVVDALVVLLVLAVGLAGIALVTGSGGGAPTNTETRNVTLDFGNQPEYVVERVEIGDNGTIDGHPENVTITDTHLTTAESGSQAIVRVSVPGRQSDGTFTVDGEPLRLGRTLSFETSEYAVNGTISDVGGSARLPTQETPVVLRGTVPSEVATSIETGDAVTVAGDTVATVEDAAAFAADPPGRRTLFLAVDLETYGTGTPRFANTRIESGNGLSLPLSGYRYNGTIERVGANLSRSTERILVTDVVATEVARQIEEGDAYNVAGRQVATIENVTAYGTDDPDEKRIYAGLSIETLGYGDRPLFGTRTVRRGATLPFGTTNYEFFGDVVRTDTADPQLRTEDVLVTGVVDGDVARSMEVGDTYDVAGQTIATIENVASYGTDDPDRKRVYVGLSVRALGFGEEPQFGAERPLREGVSIPFRTESYDFAGEIVRVGAFDQPGQSNDRTVTLEMKNVAPERANSVSGGMTETAAGQTVAEIQNVTVEPAIVTLTSDDGDIFRREHPVNKDVTITAQLSVREHESGIRFKGRTLQEGNEITLDLGTTTITATVVDLDGE